MRLGRVVRRPVEGGSVCCAEWTGRGAGVDDKGLARKAEIVDMGLVLHTEIARHPLELLARLG